MAFLTKLNVVVLVLILLSFYGARTTSASSLHQREKQNWRWFSDCRSGHRKLSLLNCESGGGSANKDRAFWSESLKSALSPPPPPFKQVAPHAGIASPPRKE
ncbi:hypothetical protein POM88_002886 [Heracleum sosnowskyi]|uniref:Secreted protein n=1 Tax=Heracleum sosnowskyi TaxID=360622 RepID=A0AAD8JGI6_9APIA|nr:hypothetical protein POM88_002886 [Heracleum sosnowskyi]